ncbi:MAG: hypothetical protein AAF488_00550 [Planctomycetota bacterium]
MFRIVPARGPRAASGAFARTADADPSPLTRAPTRPESISVRSFPPPSRAIERSTKSPGRTRRSLGTGGRTVALAAAIVASLLAGCRSVDERAERAYWDRDLPLALELLDERTEDEVMSYASTQLLRASIALEAGRLSLAERALGEAAKVIADADGPLPRRVAAAMRRQAGALYRGAPHEVVACCLYRALLAMRRHDFAAAESSLEIARRWAVPLLTENGEAPAPALCFLEKILAYRTDAPPPPPDLTIEVDPSANVIVWIDAGFGPLKQLREGNMPSTYAHTANRVASVTVRIGDHPPFVPMRVFNTRSAARTYRGAGGASTGDPDAEGELVGGFLSLISQSLRLFTVWAQAPQDARCWWSLPETSYAWAGRLDPGVHEIEVQAFDAGGEEIPEARRRFQLTLRDQKLRVVYDRCSPRDSDSWR